MQAIEVKTLPPTNMKPKRVKAFSHGHSVTMGWNYGLNYQENEVEAARKLCQKLQWKGRLTSGTLKNGNAVFIFEQLDNSFEV